MKNIAPLPRRRLRRSIFAGSLLILAALVVAVLPQRSSVASRSTSDNGGFRHSVSSSPSPAIQTNRTRLEFFNSSGPSVFALSPSPVESDQPTGLIGLNSVSVGSTQAMVDSFDSAQGPYSATNRGSAAVLISNGPVSIDGSKVLGNVRSNTSSVALKRQGLVTGNVFAGTTILNNGTINGSATPYSPSASIVAQSVAPCSRFSPASRIGGKFTYDAAKGDLTINGNSTATLTNGSYCFHSLTLSGKGKLAVSGAVKIYLTGQFAATGNSSSDTGGVPANLQILSSYTGDNGVLLQGTTNLYMTIYAPQTSVSLMGTPQLYGSVLGKTLSVSGNPSLHFDSQLAQTGNTNTAPVVIAGDNQTITLPANAILAGSATDDGLPNPPATLTYLWTQDAGPDTASITNPTQATTTVSFPSAGTYVFRLTASDSALSDSATVQVTVNPRLNQPPSVNAGANQTITLPSAVTLSGSASDDGLPNPPASLTYLWSQDSGPTEAIITSPGQLSTQVSFTTSGTYVFRLAASDSVLTGSATVEIKVNPIANHPPQFGAQADERVQAGGAFARTLVATDQDAGDTLSFQLIAGPAGLTLSGNQLSWNPVTTTPGEYFATIKVTDSAGAIDSARFKLTVFALAAPEAKDDFYETSLGQSLFVPTSGVLTNDADPNGGTLTATKLTAPDKGTVSAFNPDGSFTYVAPAAPAGPVFDVKRTMSIPNSGSLSGIIAADLDSDGKSEVILNGATGPFGELQAYSSTGALLFKLAGLPPAQIGGQTCNTFQNTGTTFAAADVDDDGQVEIVLPVSCVGDSSTGDRAAAIAYDPTLPEKVRVKWMTQPVTNAPETLFIPVRSIFSIARLHPNEKPVVLFGSTISSPSLGNYYCKMLLSTSTDSACRAVWAYKGEDGTLARMYYSAPADQSSLSGAYAGGHTFEGQGGYMGPVVADVEGDGAVEILYEGTLWNTDGTIKRQFDGAAPHTATQSSTVVELDGDAQMEIVTLDTTRGTSIPGSLKAWKADGTLLWNTPLPRGGFTSRLSVADVDRDGLPDFSFTIGGSIWVLDQSGHIKWIRNFGIAADGFAFQFGINAGGGTRLPVYDLNGDGTPEMIVQYGNNTIMFLRADTGEDQISWTYPGAPAYSSSAAYNGLIPVVADLDGSGHASVIWNYKDTNSFGAESYLQVLRGDTVPWQPAPGQYNQAAYWESNFNADGSVPKTYTRHTTDPRTNVFGQQPQAPYAPDFVPATETSFNYSATNTDGLSSTATVKIKIAPQNRAPVFTTKPPKTYVGPFVQMNVDYMAHAVDPDPGNTITYGLVFSQGHNGVVSVEPTTGVVHLSQLFQGDQHFIISATDNHGAASYQAFTLRMVAGTTTVPNVVGMAQADASSALTSAQLSVGAITQQHNAAPAGTVLGQSPLAGTTLPQGESVDLIVSLGPLPDVTPPEVSINSPADGSRITTLTNIVGTVSNGLWRLEYSLNSDDGSPAQVWTTFASGNGPVNNAVLGTFDPTLLLNGSYTVRLVSANAAGQTSVANLSAVVTGNQKIGNFTVSFSDLQTPVAGLPIEVIRTYDSRDKRVGDFGVGWTLGLRNVRLEKSGVLGANWEQTSSGGLFSTYCIQPTRSHLVTITFPDDKVYQFEATVAPQCQLLVPIETAKIGFRPTANTRGTLSIEGDNDVLVVGSVPGPVDLLSFDNANPFNSKLFRLTTQEGMVFVIDQQGGVRSMSDPNGNTLTVNASGITHSSGKSISFTRDAQGRITHITDPAGNVRSYSYDANGDLVSFTDSESNTTTFTYDSTHLLLTINDPRGIQPIRNEYDADGRLISHTDAFGKKIIYTHNPGTRQETITDRLGNLTLFEYDANGNVVRSVDAAGGVKLFTYDSDDNLLSETNALGHTTTYTYDAQGNRTSETNALGNTIRFTSNSLGQPLTMTDALGRVTSYTYDAGGVNLLSTKDSLGNVTSYTYNSTGQVATVTDALGNAARYEYDASGNVIKQTDALGFSATYSYDANGNQTAVTVSRTLPSGQVETITTGFQYDRLNRAIKTTLSDGTMISAVYNEMGQKSVSIDQLGRQTTYSYDAMGRLTLTTYPDGLKESSTYDAEGRRLSSTDRAGHVTNYTYDSLGRLTKTTYPDGTSTTTVYNAIGQAVSATDARGNTTTYEYDAAGRRTKVKNSLGHVSTFTYDAAGNQLSMTDAKGNTTRYEYDAAGRRIKVIYADLTIEMTTYDALGRIIARTDQAGRITQSSYDAVGRLTKVTDALGKVTQFGYDELGQKVSQTDANNRTTRYEYNALGQRTKRVLPLGMAETYSYDAAGRLSSRTDFNGKTTTYMHDALNRLLSKSPDPSLNQPGVSFSYTPTGRRASMTDATGTTIYTYDTRDRLTSKQTPQGTLTYTYDAAGHLLTTRSSNTNGVSVDYSYDSLNRLGTVTDNRLAAGANVTTYSYDSVGNLQSYLYPNGVQTSHTYNNLNRLTAVSISNGPSQLAGYSYTLGPAGNRLSVTESNGRSVQYTYDALYRLTKETVSNDSQGVNGSVAYTYDAVSNRLTRNSSLPGIATQNYAYDANDRLQSDSYDQNGNTTSSQGNTYNFDFENRISDVNQGAVTYLYDGDGNRVGKKVGQLTIKYLVDTNNLTGYAQVVDELQNGVVTRTYTYGHSLISQNQVLNNQWQASFYGYDGHGSVRLLTDAAGAVTDTYTYDAFGNLIAQTGATPNEHLFTGEALDAETGFYYLRARYLNTWSGRFMTSDSYEGRSSDPQSLHKYLYAHNNPVMNIDPSGHLTLKETLTSIGILGGMLVANIQGTLAVGAVSAAAGSLPDAMGIGVYAARGKIEPADMLKLLPFLKFNESGFSVIGGVDSVIAPREMKIASYIWLGAEPGGTRALKPTDKRESHGEYGAYEAWHWNYHLEGPGLHGHGLGIVAADFGGSLYGVEFDGFTPNGLLFGRSTSHDPFAIVAVGPVGSVQFSSWTATEGEMISIAAVGHSVVSFLQGNATLKNFGISAADPRAFGTGVVGAGGNAAFAKWWVQKTYGRK